MHFFPVFHLFYVIQFENGILKLKQESWPTNEEKIELQIHNIGDATWNSKNKNYYNNNKKN